MSNWFGTPKPGQPHVSYRDVRIQHAGKRWTATWHVEGGHLIVSSAWGSASEPIRDYTDPSSRAAELLHAIVASRTGQANGPVGF
jgi:hypothetical protein